MELDYFTPVAMAEISCLDKALPNTLIYPCITLTLRPPLLRRTRKCEQEAAVPHIRLLVLGQVHPGNGAMCDCRHAVDTVQGAVTVIKIRANFKCREN